MRKALCVGINDYPGGGALQGCVNDARLWMQKLLESGYSVTAIYDMAATHDNILKALVDILQSCKKYDRVVFTYSGHGTYVRDDNDDEEDYYDEALYVYDGTILDDELRAAIDDMPDGVQLTVILDSCFAGTMTRNMLNGKPRFWATDVMPPGTKRRKPFLRGPKMREGLLAGCGEDEYSYDAYLGDTWQGAFTYYANKTLVKEETYNLWINRIRSYLPSDQYPQTPQLEGPDYAKGRKVFYKEPIATNVEPEEEPKNRIWLYIILGIGVIVAFIVGRLL